ncbi:OstA-like protein [Niabella sp. CJ426]|uniref:OstA-like protein n=1 Tax=Niabella sp. CJ426 TaxID=3393740 RepID=UPI003CFEAF05
MIKKTSKSLHLFFPVALLVLGCLVAYSTTTSITKHTGNRARTVLKDTIKIIHSNTLSLKKESDTNSLVILEGDVVLKQGNTLFKADKAIKNDRQNTFEAWGHVHINDGDTTNIYSDHLKYFGNPQVANLDGNVRLTDGQATLTTPSLVYNMVTNTGVYKEGGKVVNKKTVITSKEGEYYRDVQNVFFKKNVIVNDPAYKITADSLQYNTATEIATFISMTHIRDSARRSIDTKEGYYNLRTKQAEFGQRPFINDDNKSTLNADKVYLDDNIARAEGNAIAVDSVRGTIIIANTIFQNRLNEAILATQKPVMIIKQDNDSLYVAADTLFSAKLSDLFETVVLPPVIDSVSHADSIIVGDSIVKTDKKNAQVISQTFQKDLKASNDSTDRYFEAFHNVRIYSDSMQAVSDSLFYSFRDSTFRLYKKPVVWGKESQITGDTILLHTKNKQPLWMEAFKNGFMVNSMGHEVFNQIKASRIDAYFIDGGLDSVRAKGSAECIYYLQDDDSAFTGVNQNTCDIIDSYFENKQLKKVAFRSNVKGTIYPIQQKKPSEMKLEGFQWHEAIRPKTKYELFE